MKNCPNCGQPVSPNDDFCPNCGAQLNTATGGVKSNKLHHFAKNIFNGNKKRRNLLIILIAIVGLFIFVQSNFGKQQIADILVHEYIPSEYATVEVDTSDRANRKILIIMTDEGAKKYLNDVYDAAKNGNIDLNTEAQANTAKIAEKVANSPLFGSDFLVELEDPGHHSMFSYVNGKETYNFITDSDDN